MTQPYSTSGKVQTGKGKLLGTFGPGFLGSTPEELTMEAVFLGALTFRPEEVVELEPFTNIPFLSQGIRIHHLRADYSPTVRFCSFTPPEELIQGIRASGFIPLGVEQEECLACKTTMTKADKACPACGWTYETA